MSPVIATGTRSEETLNEQGVLLLVSGSDLLQPKQGRRENCSVWFSI